MSQRIRNWQGIWYLKCLKVHVHVWSKSWNQTLLRMTISTYSKPTNMKLIAPSAVYWLFSKTQTKNKFSAEVFGFTSNRRPHVFTYINQETMKKYSPNHCVQKRWFRLWRYKWHWIPMSLHLLWLGWKCWSAHTKKFFQPPVTTGLETWDFLQVLFEWNSSINDIFITLFQFFQKHNSKQ